VKEFNNKAINSSTADTRINNCVVIGNVSDMSAAIELQYAVEGKGIFMPV
jgi:hypothetical protein